MPIAGLTQICKFIWPHDVNSFKHDHGGVVDGKARVDVARRSRVCIPEPISTLVFVSIVCRGPPRFYGLWCARFLQQVVKLG
jgi:hypothetical protein